MTSLGKLLITFGVVLVGLGLLMTFFDKIPFLGRLPGDIHVKRENFQFYFPIVTSIVLSLILTLILWLISYFGKK
jgi:hypothetical protein